MESEAPKHKAQPPLSFGLLLSPELAASVLERGPPADSPKVTSPVSIFCACVCSVLFLIFPFGLKIRGHFTLLYLSAISEVLQKEGAHLYCTVPYSILLVKNYEMFCRLVSLSFVLPCFCNHSLLTTVVFHR